jgi:putative endonuclease
LTPLDQDVEMPGQYYVYILASSSRHLYVGITNDLARRVAQHRAGFNPESWAHQHGATRLVYFEWTNDARGAITREKQIKGWTRLKKIQLIESANPGWQDHSPAPSLRSG